ncbi:UDP-N-acetylglucosamine 2-epimerase (non-hydrolyzing) [Leucobacter allii]|uniref:non-hydrolyzing UDP-N-acetylglucosamine 2-epimerase n=1 Tax=Leucobacter allii TaxID=2932247 RepID=UPI001FD5253B|nr:UDP-N-acetylglucosamine 2-epimerase (non-hydrolyzing) [Leucobacter allii]UOR00427.1 UDP-N-acetylglucosamine 2-epimerase (non-hydrolyzing) [Leucobacter allii]
MIPYEERTRVLVVIGTRPEAIKMIPVIRALQASETFRPVVIATGQHTDLVDELLRRSGMRVDANLRVSEASDGVRPTLNGMFARVMTGIDRIWASDTVDEPFRADGRRRVSGAAACLVHGDTSSAAAAALAAFNLQIPVVHVEAGLRTSNLLSPFPEEGNRQLISRIAALHLAPTTANKMNLVREGVDYDRVLVTGNTSIDMLSWASSWAGGFGPGLEALEPGSDGSGPRIVLVTAHRRENWGAGLERIAAAVRTLAERYPETRFAIPMHPNPVARAPLQAALAHLPNAHLVEPREYLDFARLMDAAHLIITDSGGVQEEAPALGTPVLVARDTTERQEGVQAGTLTLVGTDPERIVAEAALLLDDAAAYAARSAKRNPYGDGRASERIVQALEHILREGRAPAELTGDALREAVRRRLGLDAADTAATEAPAAPEPAAPESAAAPEAPHG